MQIHTAHTQNFVFGRAGIVLVLIASISMMTACGSKDGNKQEKTSQTIARVNGDEITIYQLNNELQRANLKPEQQDAAAKQVVRGLIDRQIVVQEAIKSKLDRNPRVLQALENDKAQILAQAYIEEKLAQVAKPTDAEISDYRTKHQDVFANRKLYLMDELAVPAEAYSTELQTVANSAKTLEEITNWLDQHSIKYRHAHEAHAAETLPQPLLAQLGKMKSGDITFIRAHDGIFIGRIQDVKDAPVSDADSKPLIERILFAEKRKAAAETEMKNLHSAAKIVYLDKKYEPGVEPAKPLASTSAAEARPAETTSNKSAEGAKPASGNIEKGLSGL